MPSADPLDIEALTDYFQERTQDALRGVYSYNEYGNIKVHFNRDDVEQQYDHETLVSMLRKAVTVEEALRDAGADDSGNALGEPKASLHTFGDSVIVQLFGPSLERGVIAAFDKDIAARHTRFVDETIDTMLDGEE